MITVFCPQCNKRYEVPDELVGMELACPNCSTRFTVQEDNGDLASPPLQPMDMSPYEDDNDELEGDTSEKITCPHCWNEFKLSQVNYISNHPTLIGDSVLGEAAQT